MRTNIMIEFTYLKPTALCEINLPTYTSFELNYKKLIECNKGQVVAIEELRKTSDAVNSILKITIQLAEGTTYDLAQNIVVYPTNSKSKVEKALDYLGIDKNDLVAIHADAKAKLPFDNLLPLEEILYKYVDLNAAPKLAYKKNNMDQNRAVRTRKLKASHRWALSR